MPIIPVFIQNIIKNLCDINGNGKLDAYVEIGNRAYDEYTIFEKACKSYNPDKKTVSIFKNGNWETTNIGDDLKISHYETPDNTRIDNTAQTLKYAKPAKKEIDSASQIISDAINDGTAKKTIIGNNIIYKVEIPTKDISRYSKFRVFMLKKINDMEDLMKPKLVINKVVTIINVFLLIFFISYLTITYIIISYN